MKNISKDYYGNCVLKDINLSVKAGEIHAILGENGAGKSTLMNILFGMTVIHSTGGFDGEIMLEGKNINIKSPQEALELGIGMVHQEFMLIPGYSVTENVKLNREITKRNFVSRIFGEKLETLDLKEMAKDTRKALDTLDMDIDEWTRVEGIPVGYMQFIEIAREIDKKNIKLLVFDEPTAVLTESEAANLLTAMQKIKESGIAILFITHRLDEVMEVADNITMLRDGELVAQKKSDETNVIELAELMVGRKVEKIVREKRDEKANRKTILEVKDLRVMMSGEEVKGIDLKIEEGEILGIGGLAGQGKIGIANGIMGIYPVSGDIILKGEKLKLNSPKDSLERKIAFVSEDRRGVGLLLDTSIEINIVVTAMQIKKTFIRNFVLFTQINQKRIKEHTLKMIKMLDIRCRNEKQLIKKLSGGNQQKICIARALTLAPDVLLVSEPTRGIDVGAKKIVLETLVRLNRDLGMTIVMTSSELAELRSVCDRIVIISGGKIEGELKPDSNDTDFGLMMAGEYKKIHSRGDEQS
ncbi:MAG: sugar ABC transporter ATP-binding protein [Clostridiales bacterium]|nr:sugar ABC transporter ATP-binding protein [Clostridiales bacterium]